MELTKTILASPSYHHTFERLDGSKFDVVASQKEYDQLASRRDIHPTHPDGQWIGYGMDSPIVALGSYATDKEDNLFLNVDGKVIMVTQAQFADSGTLKDISLSP